MCGGLYVTRIAHARIGILEPYHKYEYVQITLVRIIPKAGSGTLLHLSYSALGFSPVKISLSITNTYEKPPRPILDANYGIVKQEG